MVWLKKAAVEGEMSSTENVRVQRPFRPLPRALFIHTVLATVLILMALTLSASKAGASEIGIFPYVNDSCLLTSKSLEWINESMPVCLIVNETNANMNATLQAYMASENASTSINLTYDNISSCFTGIIYISVGKRNNETYQLPVIDVKSTDLINITVHLNATHNITREVLVDALPPIIVDLSINNASAVNGTPVVYNHTLSIDLLINETSYPVSGVNHTLICKIEIDGTTHSFTEINLTRENVTAQSLVELRTAVDTSLSDGNHTLIVECSDSAGNSGRKNLSFIADTSALPVPNFNFSEIVLSTRSDVDGCVLFDENGTHVINFINWSSNNSSIAGFQVEVSSSRNFGLDGDRVLETSQPFLNLSDICEFLVSPPFVKFLRVRSRDGYGRVSNWSNTVKVIIVKHEFLGTVENVTCSPSDMMCYFVSGQYSEAYTGIMAFWKWEKTVNVRVGEVIRRFLGLNISDVNGIVALNNSDAMTAEKLRSEDNRYLHLNSTNLLNLTLTGKSPNQYICIRYTTLNASLNVSVFCNGSYIYSRQFSGDDIMCVPAFLESCSESHVLLRCNNVSDTYSCAIDRVWSEGNLRLHYNLNNILFSGNRVAENVSIDTGVSSTLLTNYTEDVCPLIASYGTRVEDSSRRSVVDDYAYSVLPATIRNLAPVRFRNVILTYHCLYPDWVCENVTVEEIDGNGEVTTHIPVKVKNIITSHFESWLQSNTSVISVNSYVFVDALFTVKNNDTIAYHNVEFRPEWSGWKSARIYYLNLTPQSSKTVKVTLKRVLIMNEGMSVKEERLDTSTFLRKINITLYAYDIPGMFGIDYVNYTIPLSSMPYFEKDSATIRLNDKVIDGTVRNSTLYLEIPSDSFIKGENQLVITYSYIKKSAALPPSPQTGSNIASKRTTGERVNKGTGKKSFPKPKPKNRNECPATLAVFNLTGKVIDNAHLTFTFHNPLNFTIFNLTFSTISVPKGWEIKIEPVTFIKPNDSVTVHLYLNATSSNLTTYTILLRARGVSEQGKSVELGEYSLVFNYLTQNDGFKLNVPNILTGEMVGRIVNSGKMLISGGVVILLFLKVRRQLKKRGARAPKRYPKLRF